MRFDIVIGEEMTFIWTNYHGVDEVRRLVPTKVFFGTCGDYREPQWMLHGVDLDRLERGAFRTFPLLAIRAKPKG